MSRQRKRKQSLTEELPEAQRTRHDSASAVELRNESHFVCTSLDVNSFARLKEIANIFHFENISGRRATKASLCAFIAEQLGIAIPNVLTVLDDPNTHDEYNDLFDPVLQQDLLTEPVKAADGIWYNRSTYQTLLRTRNRGKRFLSPVNPDVELSLTIPPIDTTKQDKVLRFIEQHGLETPQATKYPEEVVDSKRQEEFDAFNSGIVPAGTEAAVHQLHLYTSALESGQLTQSEKEIAGLAVLDIEENFSDCLQRQVGREFQIVKVGTNANECSGYVRPVESTEVKLFVRDMKARDTAPILLPVLASRNIKVYKNESTARQVSDDNEHAWVIWRDNDVYRLSNFDDDAGTWTIATYVDEDLELVIDTVFVVNGEHESWQSCNWENLMNHATDGAGVYAASPTEGQMQLQLRQFHEWYTEVIGLKEQSRAWTVADAVDASDFAITNDEEDAIERSRDNAGKWTFYLEGTRVYFIRAADAEGVRKWELACRYRRNNSIVFYARDVQGMVASENWQALIQRIATS